MLFVYLCYIFYLYWHVAWPVLQITTIPLNLTYSNQSPCSWMNSVSIQLNWNSNITKSITVWKIAVYSLVDLTALKISSPSHFWNNHPLTTADKMKLNHPTWLWWHPPPDSRYGNFPAVPGKTTNHLRKRRRIDSLEKSTLIVVIGAIKVPEARKGSAITGKRKLSNQPTNVQNRNYKHTSTFTFGECCCSVHTIRQNMSV